MVMSIASFKSIFQMGLESIPPTRKLFVYCIIDRFDDEGEHKEKIPVSGLKYALGELDLMLDDPVQISHPIDNQQLEPFLRSLNLMPEQEQLLNACFVDARDKKMPKYPVSEDTNTLIENEKHDYELLFWTEPMLTQISDEVTNENKDSQK